MTTSLWRPLPIAACVCLSVGFAVADADDPLPDVDSDRPVLKRATPAKTVPHDHAGKKVVAPVGPAAGINESEIERLERAIAGMRQASQRLESEDLGGETQKLQESVVRDLEQLLELLKRQQQNPSQNNSQQQQNRDQQQQQQQQQSRQQTSKEQLDPKNSKSHQKQQQREQKSQGRDDQKAREAQERTDAARAAEAEQARRRRIVKDVWGHLPPHVREALQNSLSERYLPQYEELVKRYYEALAEKNHVRDQ